MGVLPVAASGEGVTLGEVIRTLEQSKTGKVLLSALPGGMSSIKWGTTSRTDAVLTRQLDPTTGREKKIREVTIFLREGSDLEDATLDLAHELVHATRAPEWDPYDPNLTLTGYIHAILEGHGGEVAALGAECRVALELSEAGLLEPGRCGGYARANSSLEIDHDRIRKDFYKAGHWKKWIEKRLGSRAQSLSLLSDAPVVFVSSTGQAPYPVALIREYEVITQTACENSVKRLNRSGEVAERAQFFISKRCSQSLVGTEHGKLTGTEPSVAAQ